MTNYNKTLETLEYDVCIAGGGPAGCTAAAAAAREGAKVLLLEATGTLGGMATSGLVPAWCPFTDDEKFIHNGLARYIFEKSNAGISHIGEKEIHGWLPLDPEALKRIFDDLILDGGVSVKFFTTVFDALTENGMVKEICCANKEGAFAVRAKVFIDCTGDADLAVFAGAKYNFGSPKKREVMMTTLCFMLSNVDTYAFMNQSGKRGWGYDSAVTGNFMHEGSVAFDIAQSEKYPNVSGFCINLIGPDTVGINALHVKGINPVCVDDMTRSMFEGRKLAVEHLESLKEFFPEAFGNAYLATTAPLMGVRESRRIICDYTLTYEDYFNRRTFADEIQRNCYFIDMHGGMEDAEGVTREGGDDLTFEAREKSMKAKETMFGKYKKFGRGESHGIPYRCLTPVGLGNLLVAGRPISVDHIVQASTRVMPNCLSNGEAAGIAAAMASKSDCDVHAVDVKKLRVRLKEEGAYQV